MNQFEQYAREVAQRHGLDPEFVAAIAATESNWNPKAVSPKGAMGIMQLMPATAKGLGVDPADPYDNIRGGVQYLAQLHKQFGGDQSLVAAAYNAGPGAVQKHGGVPNFPETQKYVAKVAAASQIDPGTVQWDTPAASEVIDPETVKWDTPAEKRTPSGLDRAQAAASGVNKGVLVNALGLPVDTALNVWDLAKAGVGTAGRATGLMRPDQMPQMTDRGSMVGSSEWIARQMREHGGAPVIDPNRPDDAASRYLHAGGQGVGAVMVGGARAGMPVRDLSMGAASQMASQKAAEAGLSPAWQALASFGPQVATTAPVMVPRGLLRGGEAGRQQMADRLDTLARAGVDAPPVGLATGNSRGAWVDALLSTMPGSAGVMARNIEAGKAGMASKVSALADDLSPQRGTLPAGQAIQSGISGPGGYKDRLNDTIARLYDRVADTIPQDARFPIPNTLTTGARVAADIPGMPAVSQLLKPDVVPKFNAALQRDAAPMSPGSMPSVLLNAQGVPFVVPTPGRAGGAPFNAMKDVRTLIGQDLADATLTPNKTKGALRQYYGALSQDMQNAATQADRMARPGAPSAVNALNRANRINAQGMDRLGVLQPFTNQVAPESAFLSLERALGDRASVGAQVLKSLTPAERATQAATIVDRLGRATPGQQNAEGTAFSPSTFLSNWNRLAPAGKDAALGSTGVRRNLDAIAQAADMMRAHDRAWSNPSGTTPRAAMYSTAAATAGAVASGHPIIAGAILGGVAANYVTAKMLTNPIVTHWLAQSTTIPAARMAQHVNRLAINSKAIKDPETRADVQAFVAALQQPADH